jgi:hypothetical protein
LVCLGPNVLRLGADGRSRLSGLLMVAVVSFCVLTDGGEETTRPSLVPSGEETTRPSLVPSGEETTRPSLVPSGEETTPPSLVPSGEETTPPSLVPKGRLFGSLLCCRMM